MTVSVGRADAVWSHSALSLLLILLCAHSSADELTLVGTPCFAVTVEVTEAHVLRLKSISPEGEERIWGFDPLGTDFPMVVQASVCGVGDWVFERQIGAECVRWTGVYREVTIFPCVWNAWDTIVTAKVEENFRVPEAPTYFASLTQHWRE